MDSATVQHETLTFKRQYTATPDAVFSTYADVEVRARWSAPSDSAVFIYTENDFRVGGIDHFRCGDKRAPQYEGEVRYEDIVSGKRIIYSEAIKAFGKRLSVSLVTWEIVPRATGSRLLVTVQIASLVGDDMIAGTRVGMNAALDNLAVEFTR